MTTSARAESVRRSRFDIAVANTGAGVGGEVADLGLRTMGSLLMARLLGPAGLGAWLVARAVGFDLGGIAARCGLDEAAVRFVARSRGREDPRGARGVLRAGLRWSALTAGLATVGLLVVAPVLGSAVFKKPEVTGLIQILAPSLLLFAPVMVLLGALQGIDRVALRVAAQKVALPGVQMAVLAIALACGWGMRGVIAAHYAGVAALAVVAVSVGLRAWRASVGRGPGTYDRRELGLFAGPLALSELSTFVILWIDILMLGALSTQTEAGIYGAGQRVAGLVALPLNAVNMMFAPMIASLHGRGEREGLAEMFRLTTRWVLFASLPLFVLIVYAGKDILGLFGAGFSAGYGALVLLAVGKLVSSATGSVGYVLNMTGHQRLNLLNTVVLGTVNAGLNVLWISRYGAKGAAAAAALSLGLVNILRVVEVRSILGLRLISRGYIVVLAGAVAGIVCVWALRGVVSGSAGSVAMGVLFLLVYGGIAAIWGLDDTDREAAKAALRRIR
ncbi:polysaccharide biosynthesis protein [Candidatus Fermentibacteria bacterium]|nr:polysaccharide biosynthesis protein [Candidatus Fermentibacteria bacterium]